MLNEWKDIPLRPSHRMSSSQSHNFHALLTPLHLKDATQIHVFAQRPQLLVHPPTPADSESEERYEQGGYDPGFAESEDADHEEQVDDDTPSDANEGDGPCLTLRFVGLVED